MDPNETLRELREAMQAYLRGEATRDLEVMAAAASDMYTFTEALDTWLSQLGGHLPDAWQRQDAYNAGRQAEATARYNAGQIGDDKPMSE